MPPDASTHITQHPAGTLPCGTPLTAYTLHRAGGLRARVLSYGGILDSLWVPGRDGEVADVILGLSSPEQYVEGNAPYFGALVGRFANRIAGGRFVLDGQTVVLPCNEPHAHLHGGPGGFSVQPFETRVENGALVLTRDSPDGEMGYPGRLSLTVRISLTPAGGLRYDYDAVTDRPTVVNLTAHPYFNLAGHPAGADRLRSHRLQVQADAFLPVHPQTATPTGILRPVQGSPFDLRTPAVLGECLQQDDHQLAQCRGLDHTFVLRPDRNHQAPAASLLDAGSGRRMDVYTDQPGIQVYTGNFLSPDRRAKDGATYGPQAGICLETQHFPDAPNIPAFPSTRLQPGERLRTWTEYRFSVYP